ncbi:hypothetical protein N7461_003432 [Penicillium sp. DV-2018c]|nr:hypothetical protein N7461_003432 [Penicillium sp. DV-2018c]
MTHRFECPYAAGNVIKIHLKTPDGLEATADASILKVFKPSTVPSVMLIRMTCSSLRLEGDMIWKLFDRRFATQLRADEEIPPWTPEIETAYRQFILDGGAAEFVTQLKEEEYSDDEDSDDEDSDDEDSDDEDNDDEDSDDEDSAWSAAMNETYLHNRILDRYKTEVQVYRNRKEIQGTDMPKLRAFAIMPVPFPGQTGSGYTDIPGILLQYIDGLPLTVIAEHTPRKSWQIICRELLGILCHMVREGRGNGSKVTMIDFVICKSHQDYENDYEWDTWKSYDGEEGAVG